MFAELPHKPYRAAMANEWRNTSGSEPALANSTRKC